MTPSEIERDQPNAPPRNRTNKQDVTRYNLISQGTAKQKEIPLQAWRGPEGSRKLRLLDYMTTAQDGGKVVSLTHRPLSPPGNIPGTHFC